ncbi:hypothetical protein Nepgr_022847 [Nepenthes gracilis]|uniref:Uncharacterized protein n=1 Tax=Nepenthes gracilis TaxID=150966 RepID=A0AAD3T086_NEPGR|nr:hypothetical protein Nepgr_022847 [Nepenthes gracilis]
MQVVSAEGYVTNHPRHFFVKRQIRARLAKADSPGDRANHPGHIKPTRTRLNGYTNLHVIRQIPLEAQPQAPANIGFIQHGVKKTNTSKIGTSNLSTISKKSSVPVPSALWTHRICYSRAEKAKGCSIRIPKIVTSVSTRQRISCHPYCARTYHRSSQRKPEINHVTTMLKSAWWTTI